MRKGGGGQVDAIMADPSLSFVERLVTLFSFVGDRLSRFGPWLLRDVQRTAPGVWKDIEAFRRDAALPLPNGLDYARIAGLSAECVAKLGAARPANLAAAARIPGVTPAALTALLGHVRGPGKGREKSRHRRLSA